ncbi:hypothetical protein [Saccharospirillum impatiens]|uniref:hypothetical protein n=1 Tax=Saccharospirillum impatiens TaxID=169438 RepID=UPI0004232A18|nr:hypothetical protein [Saccharospirillum impatiens]
MSWIIIPDQPLLSAMVWVAIAMVAGYVARASVVRLLNALTGSIRLLLRAQSKALIDAADQLRRRNQAVLLEMGQQRLERRLDREFHQVWHLIDRDLAQFPHWQRQISEHISQLEEDYHKTAETPPPAPDWLDSIAAVVRLKETQSGNPAFSSVLKDLEANLNRQHEQALHDYRKSMSQRHRLLHSMMPQWRKLSHAIERIRSGIRGLLDRARDIDRHMDQYQRLVTGTEQASRGLQVSLLVDGFLSAMVLLLWCGVAWLSFDLMNAPLQALMAVGEPLAGLAMNDWAGLMLIGVSVFLGWLLMESLRITHVFDGLYGMDSRDRRRLVWVLASLLVLSALAQAGLVYMHHRAGMPVTELERLIQYPVIVYEAPLLDQGLVLGARMMLAFVLPLLLIFFAVPFERLIHCLRIVIVALVGFALRILAWVLRLASGWLWYANRALQAIYDVFIGLPLWLASRWRLKSAKAANQSDGATEIRKPV